MTAEKKETTAKKDTAEKQIKAYKVTGKKLKSKTEANKELKEVFKKGFKNAGLMVQGDEFVILFGTYPTEQIAKANAEAVKKSGFTVAVEEQK